MLTLLNSLMLKHGLRFEELITLQELPLTPTSIAKLNGFSTAGATHIIDAMEKRQLVRRDRDPKDRRIVNIHHTPAGEAIRSELKTILTR